jgi:hypothetical protein
VQNRILHEPADIRLVADVGAEELGIGTVAEQLLNQLGALGLVPACQDQRGCSCANASAVARPIPLRAPVIRTTDRVMMVSPSAK